MRLFLSTRKKKTEEGGGEEEEEGRRLLKIPEMMLLPSSPPLPPLLLIKKANCREKLDAPPFCMQKNGGILFLAGKWGGGLLTLSGTIGFFGRFFWHLPQSYKSSGGRGGEGGTECII